MTKTALESIDVEQDFLAAKKEKHREVMRKQWSEQL